MPAVCRWQCAVSLDGAQGSDWRAGCRRPTSRSQEPHSCAFRQAKGGGLLSQALTRAGPALYAAAASPRLPNRFSSSRKYAAECRNNSMGSNGSTRPCQLAVAGMNCAIPAAPFRLIAWASKRLCCQTTRAKNSTGRALPPLARGKCHWLWAAHGIRCPLTYERFPYCRALPASCLCVDTRILPK